MDEIELYRSLLSYEPESGRLSWLVNRTGGIKEGMTAGSIDGDGYVSVSVMGKTRAAHRVCWALFYGELPAVHIDHINGVRTDNRIINLRSCNRHENQQNRRKTVGLSSKYLGVYSLKSGKWQAQIAINRKTKHLGTFQTQEEAYSAYLEAKKQIHAFNPVPRDESNA